MDKELAKQVILEAIDLAMKKGCYGVIENSNIITAISVLEINKNNPITNTLENKED